MIYQAHLKISLAMKEKLSFQFQRYFQIKK